MGQNWGIPNDQDVRIGFLARLRFWQTVAGLAAAALLGCAAWREWWPFATHPAPLSSYAHPSVWQFLLSDRITLGLVRAVIAALVLYVAVSVPALVAAGRWMRAFGTSGLTADDAQDARKTIAELEATLDDVTDKMNRAATQAARLQRERDRARDLLRRLRRPSSQTPAPGQAAPGRGEASKTTSSESPIVTAEGDHE